MAARDLPVGPAKGARWQAWRFALNAGCVSMTMGQLRDGDVGSLRWMMEPHSFCHAAGDYVFMFSAMPTGPQETVVMSKWLVHKDAVEVVDDDPAKRSQLLLLNKDFK